MPLLEQPGWVLSQCRSHAEVGQPPARTQAVIHRQEVSSWWSLPDLQMGLVPMGTVGSRQVRPQLPDSSWGLSKADTARGLSMPPCWGWPAARASLRAGPGCMTGFKHMFPGSILVLVSLCRCISGAVGATGQRGQPWSNREGVSSVSGQSGQGAGRVSVGVGLER